MFAGRDAAGVLDDEVAPPVEQVPAVTSSSHLIQFMYDVAA